MLILKASKNNALKIFEKSKSLGLPFIFPTDTIFGIGAPIGSTVANLKIFELKKRPLDMPFPILAGSLSHAEKYADLSEMSQASEKFVKENLHKKITFIFKSRKNIDPIYVKDGKIAIRIVSLDYLRDALLEFGEAITATSVNQTKEKANNDFASVFNFSKNNVSLFLSGTASQETSSEIYDVSGENVEKKR